MVNDIRRIGQTPPPPLSGGSRGPSKPAPPPSNRDGSSGDRVTLTTPDLVQKTHSIPEVRTDRVQEIKMQIDRGEYDVDSKNVADRMIQDTVKDLVAPDLASKVTGR